MQITRATDYAVRVMVYLASLPPDRKAPLGELAEATSVRDNFLSKILQRLVRNGLISSHRGTGGGFRLSVTPDNLTLLQVVEAIEGKIALNICLSEWQSCPLQSQCAVYPVWQKADAYVEVQNLFDIRYVATSYSAPSPQAFGTPLTVFGGLRIRLE